MLENKKRLTDEYLNRDEAEDFQSILTRWTAQPPNATKDEVNRINNYLEKMLEKSGNAPEVLGFGLSVATTIFYSLLAELKDIKGKAKSKGMVLIPKRKLE